MSPCGQTQALDEKHCFQEIPLAVTIVFVCFLMFYQGRPTVSFQRQIHMNVSIQNKSLQALHMCLELWWNSMLNEGH